MRHTGLRVPHTRWKMSGPGVISLDGEPVGEVTIDLDDDFAEAFAGYGPDAAARTDSFYEWAGMVRDETGHQLDLEDVFEFLRAEYATEWALRQAAKDGCTVAQAMVPYGDVYMPGETLAVWPADSREDVIWRTKLADQQHGTWWRIFNGKGWDELEPNLTVE
jgi:hypothetical protein